jgi:uncharacterized protein (TIGR00730 family)
MEITSVAVFCGSSFGTDPRHRATAEALGRALAERGIRLVYGGGHVGLMGAIADAAIDAGGEVIGIIPQTLADREVMNERITELHVVPDMHVRKAMMADMSDAFIALPGGIGTLEEIAEQWTWSQLGIHDKPAAFLDELGYYAPLQQMVAGMVDGGFLKQEIANRVRFTKSIDEVMNFFESYSV